MAGLPAGHKDALKDSWVFKDATAAAYRVSR